MDAVIVELSKLGYRDIFYGYLKKIIGQENFMRNLVLSVVISI